MLKKKIKERKSRAFFFKQNCAHSESESHVFTTSFPDAVIKLTGPFVSCNAILAGVGNETISPLFKPRNNNNNSKKPSGLRLVKRSYEKERKRP